MYYENCYKTSAIFHLEHFIPLLDSDSREITGNEGRERGGEQHATKVLCWNLTADIAVMSYHF